MVRSFRFLLLTVATFASLPALAEDKPLTKGDVQAIVKEYIASNPKEVLDAMRNAQIQERQEEASKTRENVTKRHDELANDAATPVAGNPKGDVTLVEFFDYNCGYCKRSLTVLQELLAQDKNLRVAFKELPILSESSRTAAKAALAVHRLDKGQYFAFHAAVMQLSRDAMNEEGLIAEAKKLGIDESKLKAEMKKPEIEQALQKNMDLASAVGVRGTPAFVVGGEFIPGAVDAKTLQALIAKAREGKKN